VTRPPVGPEIDGFVVLEHLGTGGYSDVFLYERRTPRMRVAVKVLKDVRLSDSELAQFAAEAETMAELADHPYIVQVFSTGTLDDGRPYLVMKYYPPPNLGLRASTERFSVSDVLRTGVKIASAVETAHRAGILHRDIKPANILVSQYGEPGLTDFGIAGHTADADDGDDLGVSIPWSPPEVLSGASNGSVQSDVYSLGATIWQLLAGRSPFEITGEANDQRALMGRILRIDARPTGRADVPASLERLLAQTLAKNPALRPRSALELAQGLQAVEQEQRFARTDIVVQGHGTTNTPARNGDGPGPDRTRLRAPTRVAAQAPLVSSAPTPVPPSRVRPESADPPTLARPVRPTPPSGPADNRPRAAAGAGAPATVRRPAAPEPAPPEPARTRRGLRRPYVLAAAVVVAVAAVVVGVLLSRGGGPARHAGDPPSTVDSADLDLPDTAGAAPSVTASVDATRHTVTFTWHTTQPAGGSFAWWPAGSPAQAKRTGASSVTLPATDPHSVCIQVEYITSGGSTTAVSAAVCGS
jgi:serine/threonine protein kinase